MKMIKPCNRPAATIKTYVLKGKEETNSNEYFLLRIQSQPQKLKENAGKCLNKSIKLLCLTNYEYIQFNYVVNCEPNKGLKIKQFIQK